MKINFLIMILAASVFSTAAQARDWNKWKISCGPQVDQASYKKLSRNSYQFHIDVGDIGGCPSDKKAKHGWKWSERQEVKSKSTLPIGNYQWSADIHIARNCSKPAYRNTLFQMHDGGSYSKGPPSWLGINGKGSFRTVKSGKSVAKVPNRPFNLTVKFSISSDRVLVAYYVNGKFLVKTNSKIQRDSDIFLKFGIYRVNANCPLTQTYKNVKLDKIQ